MSDAAFESIEREKPDLQEYAFQALRSGFRSISDDDGSGEAESLLKVAREVERILDNLNLKAKVWMDIMEAVGTDMLQVGSTDDRESSNDRQIIVGDLQELADMAAKRNMRIGYEMWCWAAYNDTWRDIWEICKAVDRDNLGLCLDTFQITGREWADPSEPDGLLAGFASSKERDDNLTKSLLDLSKTIPANKIFYFQISDATHVKPPINEQHPVWDGKTPARGLWSHDYRPLPYESDKGAYLPVEECTAAVLRTGYRGPFSYEVFYKEDMEKDDKDVPRRWTQKSIQVHKRLMKACEKLL